MLQDCKGIPNASQSQVSFPETSDRPVFRAALTPSPLRFLAQICCRIEGVISDPNTTQTLFERGSSLYEASLKFAPPFQFLSPGSSRSRHFMGKAAWWRHCKRTGEHSGGWETKRLQREMARVSQRDERYESKKRAHQAAIQELRKMISVNVL